MGWLYYAFSALMLPMHDSLQWDTITWAGTYSLMRFRMALTTMEWWCYLHVILAQYLR